MARVPLPRGGQASSGTKGGRNSASGSASSFADVVGRGKDEVASDTLGEVTAEMLDFTSDQIRALRGEGAAQDRPVLIRELEVLSPI